MNIEIHICRGYYDVYLFLSLSLYSPLLELFKVAYVLYHFHYPNKLWLVKNKRNLAMVLMVFKWAAEHDRYVYLGYVK